MCNLLFYEWLGGHVFAMATLCTDGEASYAISPMS